MSEVETDKKANAPPEVITVDTVSKDIASDATPTKGDSASQARTPKHANKSKEDEAKSLGDPENISSHHQRIPPAGQTHAHGAWNGPPPQVFQSSSYPPHFDQHRQGAFQPHDRHSFPPNQGHPPMQVSPGGGRYYFTSNGPNRYTSNYDLRYATDFSQAPSYPHQRTYGGPPPLYPQQYPTSGGGGYEGRPSASWGLPPSFPQGRPPHHHSINHPEHFSRRAAMINNEGGSNVNFSRAVSSSFDRSIKSAPEKSHHRMEHSPKLSAVAQSHPDSGSYSEDASWGALQQVHSVDEDEMRKRLSKRKARDASNDVIVNQPASNSSSLTNSPTDGVEGKEKNAPAAKPSSLDSLSSVASAQEPLDTKEASKAHSPDRSTPSLDLMKCPSGSSALLLPSHQRSFSQLSMGMESKGSTKRDHDDDEEREGTEERLKDDAKGKSDEPVSKKARRESGEKKSSPLSITCSPPTTPGAKKKRDAKMHQPHAMYPHRKDESPAFYDRAPSYTYSIESGAHMPLPDAYATVQRPGSSASSTITPMQVDGPDSRHPPGVGQMPSWEIHAQDSFGATSVNGGNPLMGSFSFQQEYQMLAPSASGDLGQMHGHPMHPHQAMESRNQSFEGGHYHGGFTRSDSMMSYEGRQMSFDGHGRTIYQGQFPPHAPSWGSAGSYPAGYVQQRMGYPPMMRNYSEDSGARTSPPPGSASMRMMPPSFPPPPEFRAPPSMVNKGGPQNTIMTSSYPSSPKGGPFGWSKEEDSRLTEIMKKYKNPRDWEPISKEHNRGRT